MWRYFVLLASLFCLALICSMGTNCGNSYGSSAKNGPYKVVGNWMVNFSATVGNTTTGYGAINASGLGAFLDTSGNIVTLPTITGVSSFSGNLTAYAVNTDFFPGGLAVETFTAQGNVHSTASITGTFASTANGSGSFTVGPYSPLSGSVVAVSGVMNGREIGFSNTLSLTFSSDGSFTGGDNFGCGVAGKLTQETPNNVFDVTYGDVGGSCLTDSETGLAFESGTDYFNVNAGADPSYLYLVMLTSTLPQVRPYVIVVYQ